MPYGRNVGGAAGSDRTRVSKGPILAAALLGCLLLALAGYVLGRSGGADVEAARLRGATEGAELARGAADSRGYQEGRRKGERLGYRASYGRAYRAAYRAKERELQAEAAQAASAPEPISPPNTPSGAPPGTTYSEELPNGRPGYVLPDGQRSLSCVGVDAETGECVGD